MRHEFSSWLRFKKSAGYESNLVSHPRRESLGKAAPYITVLIWGEQEPYFREAASAAWYSGFL